MGCLHHGIDSCKLTGSNAGEAASSPVHDTGQCCVLHQCIQLCFAAGLCCNLLLHQCQGAPPSQHCCELVIHGAVVCIAVLPDAERSHHSYVNMVFDNDPTAEHERLAKLSNKQRRRISGLLTFHLPDFVTVGLFCIMLGQIGTGRADQILPL